MVDEKWKAQLAKIDPRFKFGVLQFSDKSAEDGRINDMVDKMEASMQLSSLSERAKPQWELLIKGSNWFGRNFLQGICFL